MEFLDINLKTPVFCSMLFTVPSTSGFKKNPYSSGFKNPYKKIRETRKIESIHELHFVWRKNDGRKPDKNAVQEFTYLHTGEEIEKTVP